MRASWWARSRRPSVVLRKKRRAETCVFIFGGFEPCLVSCTWNRRRSSAVAVSGERPRKMAKVSTCLM